MRTMIGECLRQAGIITEADLQTALVEHKRSGERLGSVLIRLNLATERQIAKALAYQLGFSYVDLAEHPPEPAAVLRIPKELALKRNCIAVAVEKNMLTVAMSDPLLFTLVQDLEFQTGYRIKQVVATRAEIVEAINRWYPDKALVRASPPAGIEARQRPGPPAPQAAADGGAITFGATPGDEDVFEQSPANKPATPETAPIIDMVELVIKSALKSRASDIHIEPTGRRRHRPSPARRPVERSDGPAQVGS